MAEREQHHQLAGSPEMDEGYVGGAEKAKKRSGRGAQAKSVLDVGVARRAPGQDGRLPIPGGAASAVVRDALADSLHGFLQS